MLSKMISFLLVFTIVSTTSYASTNDGLKQAVDELNYSLTVEWNQSDKEFFNAQVERFKSSVNDLRANGFTEAELLTFFNSQLTDERVARDFQTALSTVDVSQLSTEELNDHILSIARKSQQQGASWENTMSWNGAFAVFVCLGLIALLVAPWKNIDREDAPAPTIVNNTL